MCDPGEFPVSKPEIKVDRPKELAWMVCVFDHQDGAYENNPATRVASPMRMETQIPIGTVFDIISPSRPEAPHTTVAMAILNGVEILRGPLPVRQARP